MKYILILFLSMTSLFSFQSMRYTENLETKKSIEKWSNSDFGLEPYKVNYLLLLGYRKDAYKSYIPTDVYKNVEAELQVSLKLKVQENILGLDERYYLSYTHQAFWQIYSESSPFRETIYNPEGFVIFPISDKSLFGLKSLKFALAHRSNGQGDNRNLDPKLYKIENRSRSVNYLYTTIQLQHNNLISELELWARIPEKSATDDNPDIVKYTGFSQVTLRYFKNHHLFKLVTRVNFKTHYGAIEGAYSYPLIIDDVYFYSKIFSGYGESLIDYNHNISKFSVGFSFSL